MFKPVSLKVVPSMAVPVSIPSSDFLPTVVSKDEMPLPPEVTKMIPRLVADLNKGTSIIDFGEGATVKVSQFADKMLDHVSMNNIGEFQQPLTEVLVLCGTINTQSIHSGKLNSSIPFLNRLRLFFSNVKTRAISNINSVREQIEDITKELVKKEADLRKNIDIMNEMYLLNLQEYYSLVAHIKAANQVIVSRKKDLEDFKQQNAGTKDPLVGLEVTNRGDYITSLEKKVYDLQAISMACLNTAPMIRNEQRSSERSIEKFKSVRSMAIPLWKKQAAIMISSLENKRAANLGKQIDDTTNAMVKGNADSVAANTVNTAKLNERGVLDVETLEYATKVLTDSVQEMLQIADEGRQYRESAVVKFDELKQTLNLNVVNKGLS